MSRLRFQKLAAALALIAALAPIALVAAAPAAKADVPTPGDTCTVPHATTQDANGRTMWCNPTTTGNHSLVWQYGGPP
jgi:hypothetical protein